MFTGLTTGTRRVAMAQAVVAPFVALAGAVIVGAATGLALLYGGLIALSVSLVLVWREWQAIQHPEWDQHRLFKQFIRTGLERLAILLGLLALGLGLLRLAPLPVLVGLVLAQFAWITAATGRK